MGFFSSSKEVESLPGLSPPLGLNSTYSASQQSTLSIKVRSLTFISRSSTPLSLSGPSADPDFVMRARVLHLPQPAKFGGDWTVIDQDGKAVVVCKGVGNTRGKPGYCLLFDRCRRGC